MIETAFPAFGLASFTLSYGLLAMSPGPNFLIVSQSGLSGSRRTALITALGVACGAGLLAASIRYCSPVLALEPRLQTIFVSVFATLLLFMGCKLILSALTVPPSHIRDVLGRRSQFWAGLFTALFNPVTAAFLAASAMRGDAALSMQATVLAVFLVAVVWFGAVALLITTPCLRSLYGRFGSMIAASSGAGLVYLSIASVFAQP